MSPELTATQLSELEGRLEALREQLMRAIEQEATGSRPVDLDEPIGRLSRMEAIQQQQMTAATARRNRTRLTMVEAAQDRIDRGTYGLCVECEEPIAVKRLMAQPEVTICIECLREREE